jgi:hypothetical protein
MLLLPLSGDGISERNGNLKVKESRSGILVDPSTYDLKLEGSLPAATGTVNLFPE